MSATPFEIDLMLVCYYSAEPYEVRKAQWHSKAGELARARLLDDGLIDEKLKATERGKAWVEFICATPLPVQSWILPSPPETGT